MKKAERDKIYTSAASLLNRQINVKYKRNNIDRDLHGKLVIVRKSSIRIELSDSDDDYEEVPKYVDIGFKDILLLIEVYIEK